MVFLAFLLGFDYKRSLKISDLISGANKIHNSWTVHVSVNVLSCSVVTVIASGQCSCVLVGVSAKAGVERCTEQRHCE